MLAWRSGAWVDVAEGSTVAQLHPGPSLFETFALRAGRVEALDDHLARLAAAAPAAGLVVGPASLAASQDGARWAPVLRPLLDGAGLTDAIVRLVLAPDGRGGTAEWVTVRPLPPTPSSVALRLLRTVRDAPEWTPRPKSGPWRNSAEALRELGAVADPATTEGLQHDARGHLCEGTRSSVAWLEGGRWCFPAASTGRLPGTAAAQFHAVLRAAGHAVADVAAPFPAQAAAIVVLRSTLAGGGVVAHEARDATGAVRWRPSDGSEAPARLLELAAARAQRCVSLL
jgi:branched-subunit amino acid aminotransferase/4-amino-4-deoxychorismate lyase